MSGKKIINLLKTFSRQERLLFEKWLKSPFFNENQQLLVLFGQLQAVIDETGELDKMSIWKALFGKTPFEDTTLRKVGEEVDYYFWMEILLILMAISIVYIYIKK